MFSCSGQNFTEPLGSTLLWCHTEDLQELREDEALLVDLHGKDRDGDVIATDLPDMINSELVLLGGI